MSEYPKVLDDGATIAAQAIAKVAEINQALEEARSYLGQFAEQMNIGARAIENSARQVGQDIAGHAAAEDPFQAALAIHTDAGFSENNAAAARVTSNLTGCLQELGPERTAFVDLQHYLVLGAVAGFSERKQELRFADLAAAMGSLPMLQEKQEQVAGRIQAYKDARIRESTARREAEGKVAQTQEAIVQALLEGSDQPNHTSAAIAEKLTGVTAELSGMPDSAQLINRALQQLLGEIDEASDALTDWQHAGAPPAEVLAAQEELNRLKAELTSSLNPLQIEDELKTLNLTKGAFETGAKQQNGADKALDQAQQNLLAMIMSMARYIITRGG